MPARRRTSQHLTDPAHMRVLAHPTRLQLLMLLRERGPQTAALLGDEVDEAPGTVSYHLSKLAAAGLIAEADDQGSDGRQRWWRALHDETQWEDAELLGDPERLGASAALQKTIGQIYAQTHAQYVDLVPTLPREWVEAGTSSDRLLKLTAAELAELRAELLALGERWADRSDAHEAGDDTRSTMLLMQAYLRP